MGEARIALLNLNPDATLSRTLREILESSPKPVVKIQDLREFVDHDASPQNDLYTALDDTPCHLIFVVLASDHTEQMKNIIRTLNLKIHRPVMIVMEENEPGRMIEFLELGAADFILPPLSKMDVLPRLWRVLNETLPEDFLGSPRTEETGSGQMIGKDPAFLAEMNKIPHVADCEASVLILGETGTGKELCARAILELSSRASRPFIAVNCGAIPTELMENELFGHVKGAFTGASKSFPGLIHQADRGTLFLDEVDCLSLQAQVKLLRFLQDKEYRRLGSMKTLRADVRVIAASNIDLKRAAAEGTFRRDLFYRLNIIPLTLPPLRDRSADIPLLARHFIEIYARKFKKSARDFSPEAIEKLMNYSWPGNIRELENIVECAVVFCPNGLIGCSDLPLPKADYTPFPESLRARKSRVIAEFEKKYIRDLLLEHHGNITRAAQAAQKNRRAFWELIRKHKIETAGPGKR